MKLVGVPVPQNPQVLLLVFVGEVGEIARFPRQVMVATETDALRGVLVQQLGYGVVLPRLPAVDLFVFLHLLQQQQAVIDNKLNSSWVIKDYICTFHCILSKFSKKNLT